MSQFSLFFLTYHSLKACFWRVAGLFIAQSSFLRKWKWHLASKWRPPSPCRSLREHDSNWAIMKCFRRSVAKFRAVWEGYKSGLALAWGRNPAINLLAADTVLLSPCPGCKAHLSALPLHLPGAAAVPGTAPGVNSRDPAQDLLIKMGSGHVSVCWSYWDKPSSHWAAHFCNRNIGQTFGGAICESPFCLNKISKPWILFSSNWLVGT